MIRIPVALIFLGISQQVFCQVPVINSFTPASGPAGTSVTITGTNFSMVPSDNIVFFGVVKAVVSGSSATSLTAIVPAAASFAPVTVTVNNLTGYSRQPFATTFPDGGQAFVSYSFKPPLIDSSGGITPLRMTTADLDGDGKLEAITANEGSNSISVYYNTSVSDTISFRQKINFNTESAPHELVTGDLDGDGRLDIALAGSAANNVIVFRNTSTAGTVSLAPPTNYITGNDGQYNLAIADLNEDGKPELIQASTNSDGILSIFENTSTVGAISFTLLNDSSMFTSTRYAILASDLNGDGRPEIIIANYEDNSIFVYRNLNSPGSMFYSSRIGIGVGASPKDIAAGDLDGDGLNDLVITNVSTNVVSFMRNTSSGVSISFAPRVEYAMPGFQPQSIAIGNLNGDNKPDIAIGGDHLTGAIALLRNTSTVGSISFAPDMKYTMLQPATDIVLADFNGDGKQDLGTAYPYNKVAFRQNVIGGPAFAQLCPPAASTSFASDIAGNNYQWQVDKNDGNGFIDITNSAFFAGATTAVLQLFSIPSSWTHYQFRCHVDGNYSSVVVVSFTNTWKGINLLNDAWENPNGWSCGVVPDSNTDVVIDIPCTLIVNSNTMIRSLTLGPNVNLFVNPGVIFTVTH